MRRRNVRTAPQLMFRSRVGYVNIVTGTSPSATKGG